jgi:uncharacterized protein with FMN-binding domain
MTFNIFTPGDNNMNSKRSVILRWLIIFSMIITVVVVVGWTMFYNAGKAAREYVGDFEVNTIQLQDARYHGVYEIWGFRTAAELEFTIKDGELDSFSFTTILNTPGHGAREEIIRRINKTNDLNFDAVTGATHTTYFARAAIKNAIQGN